MQTFFRVTLLGTCAAIGVAVAVAVALKGTAPAGTSLTDPDTWSAWLGSKSPHDAEPIAIAPPQVVSQPAETPANEHAASKGPTQNLSASEPVAIDDATQEVELSQFEPAQLAANTADSPAQFQPQPGRGQPLLLDSVPLIRQPPSLKPTVRKLKRPAPREADDEPTEDLETLPSPGAPAGPTVAEIQRDEADGTYTLNLQNEDLRAVLSMLSSHGFNILASKNVQGAVTARVNKVDLEHALKAILQSNGFKFRREGNFIYVGTQQDFVEMDQLKDKIGTRIYRTNYVRAGDLQTLVTPMLTPQIGKMTISTPAEIDIAASNTKTGGNSFANEEVIIVRDYEAVLLQVDQIVEEVDKRPQQVAIEAMILSVQLNDTLNVGVDFTALRDINNAALFIGSPLPAVGAVDVTRGGLKFGFLGGSMGNFITALETVGDVNVVASPKLMCLNKQRAEILIGQQLGYISSTVTETSTTQQVQFLDVGTQLRIRPFISRDGMIRMEVHPELSTGNVKVVGTFTLPEKAVTQVTTNIMCRDGCTVVIGGLIREDLSQNHSQVPVLGNVPGVGWLFRRKLETKARNEIIVVITPRIVGDVEMAASGHEADEYLHRQAVYAEKMSPLGRRHIALHRLRKAQEAWEQGNMKAALRQVDLSLQFDPVNLDAIHLRDEITGAGMPHDESLVSPSGELPSPSLPPDGPPLAPAAVKPASRPAVRTVNFEADPSPAATISKRRTPGSPRE